ncbi:heat shock protein hsp20 [Moniliophthora roreri MCA 2997]|uniref:Heat shock protein hsp20 n=1 Tax=Moniliophthora roreri (strain MCA 2997) TaxID=1381753 RepID=V2XWU8_MONRO|nr:heat shock protein hsp20 [Moniliophthora roreri MCA 2997]
MSPTSTPNPTGSPGSALQPQFSSLERGLVLQLAGNIARRILEQRQRLEFERRRGISRQGPDFWLPRVDIFDDPDSPDVVAVFELPGVRREDAKVNVRGGKLIVEGERRIRYKSWTSDSWVDSEPSATDSQINDMHDVEDINPVPRAAQVPRSVAELRYGHFKREFALPEGVDPSHIRVLLENGMLHVQWPRHAPCRVNSPKRALSESTEESATSRKRHCSR